MRHQIIQHNKFRSKKYLFLGNQVQELQTVGKNFKLTYCCDKFKQIKSDLL